MSRAVFASALWGACRRCNKTAEIVLRPSIPEQVWEPGTARNGKSDSGMRPRGLTAPFVLGALAFRALYVIVRTGSLGVQSCVRHRELLGALAFRVSHVIGGSWEPWRSKLSTPPTRLNMWVPPPGALGSLGVESVSVTGAYWGGNLGVKAASVTAPLWGPRAHTTVRTEPWCLEAVTS